jgi:hypothetical protein
MPLLASLKIGERNRVSPLRGMSADHLLGIVRGCPQLTMLEVFQPLVGNSDTLLVQMAPFSTWLRIFSYAAAGAPCTGRAVKAIAESCPSLTSLSFQAAPDLSDDAITALAQKCPALRHLTIKGAAGLTDASVHALAKHCADLSHLALLESTPVTPAGLLHLLHHCSKLRYVGFPKASMSAEVHVVMKGRAW